MRNKSKIIIPIIVIAILLALVLTTVFIYFSTPTYIVSFDPNGGSMSITQTEVRLGESYSLPRPTREGYTFYGWYYNGELIVEDGVRWEIEENIALVATWVVTFGDYHLEAEGDGYAVTEFKGTPAKEIIVPQSINDKPIVSIKDTAFDKLKNTYAKATYSQVTVCVPTGCVVNAGAIDIGKKVKAVEYDLVDGEFIYKIVDNSLTLVACKSDFKLNVIVPQTYKGMQVTGIGANAFEYTKELLDQTSMSFTSLFLPLSIKTVGENAFANCHGLKVSMCTMADGKFKEVSDLSILFAWSETVTIEEGNANLLDVATQVRPAFGWSAYTSALYYVKLDANGGTVVSGIELRRNASYELPIPVREGYTFDGWYYGETEIEQSGEKWGYAKHIRLTAKWIENEKEGD